MAGLSWSSLAGAVFLRPDTLPPGMLLAETAPWHQEMVVWAQQISIVLIVAAMVACIYRLLRGPHLVDRALAVDTLAVQLVGLVTLLTMRLGTLVYFDGILVLSLLGFAGTVAIAQYIGRPHLKKNRSASDALVTPQPSHRPRS